MSSHIKGLALTIVSIVWVVLLLFVVIFIEQLINTPDHDTVHMLWAYSVAWLLWTNLTVITFKKIKE